MLVQLWSLVPVLTSATGALPTVVMKVVGLISGGKDSIYNLQLCVEQGHTIGKCIALRGVWAYHRMCDIQLLEQLHWQTWHHEVARMNWTATAFKVSALLPWMG